MHQNETNSITRKIIYKLAYKSGVHKDAHFDKDLKYQKQYCWDARPPSLEVFTFSNSVERYYGASAICVGRILFICIL